MFPGPHMSRFYSLCGVDVCVSSRRSSEPTRAVVTDRLRGRRQRGSWCNAPSAGRLSEARRRDGSWLADGSAARVVIGRPVTHLDVMHGFAAAAGRNARLSSPGAGNRTPCEYDPDEQSPPHTS